MLFNSTEFILFFPMVILIYFFAPNKARTYILLIASYIFYMGWSAKYALLIATSTIVTYLSGYLIDKVMAKESLLDADSLEEAARLKKQDSHKNTKQLIVAICFMVNLFILFIFKYLNFFVDNISSLLSLFHITVTEPQINLMLPVGISFYTFQALSYTVDVYRGDIKAEKNFFRYALFVSFFPQLVAGPIERSGNLLKQIDHVDEIEVWNFNRIMNGLTVMLWGYFMKMVIADRISKLADFALSHDNIWMNDSMVLLIGVLAFSIQIYCDFASYSTIAIGAAEVMGFSLMENFNTPYFAISIKDFWSRWHISLSTWFRDYLYIPLGGNRKGKARKYLNLLIVFLVSGLWHGASWTFVIWGLIHAVYQIIGDLTAKPKSALMKKMNVRTDSGSYKLVQMGITYTLVNFAWIFFRAESIGDAFTIISRIFTQFDPWSLMNGVIYKMGLSTQEMNILFVALIVMILVDAVKYKKHERLDQFLQRQFLPVRWGVLLFLLIFVLVFGSYGPAFNAQDFIYFQF